MEIEIKASQQLTPQERKQLEELSAEAFPADQHVSYVWSDVDWYVLVWEGEILASCLEIIERTARVNGLPVKLGGIGGVATKTDWRRRGLAEAALKIAHSFLRRKLAVDFGLLICSEKLIPYYGKFGWEIVQEPMLIDQPDGKVTYSNPVMILPVCKNEWPRGEIDLCGLPW